MKKYFKSKNPFRKLKDDEYLLLPKTPPKKRRFEYDDDQVGSGYRRRRRRRRHRQVVTATYATRESQQLLLEHSNRGDRGEKNGRCPHMPQTECTLTSILPKPRSVEGHTNKTYFAYHS